VADFERVAGLGEIGHGDGEFGLDLFDFLGVFRVIEESDGLAALDRIGEIDGEAFDAAADLWGNEGLGTGFQGPAQGSLEVKRAPFHGGDFDARDAFIRLICSSGPIAIQQPIRCDAENQNRHQSEDYARSRVSHGRQRETPLQV
jgi:hypothetical protein